LLGEIGIYAKVGKIGLSGYGAMICHREFIVLLDKRLLMVP
jgi:hypothetical protein